MDIDDCNNHKIAFTLFIGPGTLIAASINSEEIDWYIKYDSLSVLNDSLEQ